MADVPVLLTVDDDPAISSAIARDLRQRYGHDYRVPGRWLGGFDVPVADRAAGRAAQRLGADQCVGGRWVRGTATSIGQKRIFEPFFTTEDVGNGTGLGLDVSYRIVVKRHRGDLRVESSPGDTRFQVRLPLSPRLP